MRSALFAAAVLLAACVPATRPLGAAAVIDAERSFAAEAQRTGWVEAFRRYAAADAIVLQPGPASAHTFLQNIDPGNLGDTTLAWAPEMAAVSSTETLGFTTGPFNGGGNAFGQYFTVWKRQADGSWKWIYDGGTDQREATSPDAQADVQVLEPVAGGSAGDAAVEILRAEGGLAGAASFDAAAGLAERMLPEGRVNRSHALPGYGPEGARAAFAGWPTAVHYNAPVRTETTPDLAFTLGEVRWDAGFGYYGRIWIRTADGWKIAYDQIIDRTPEAPPIPRPD